jgi:RNA polymerase sigma factor (sigma-70 family)
MINEENIPQNKEDLLSLDDERLVCIANQDSFLSEFAMNIIINRYKNLLKNIESSQKDLRYTAEDKKDVKSNIYKHFIVRVRKFNPDKKVPFAGYIKRMLNQDVMNEYGGKKNASGNIGLRSSFCRRWANEINMSDYVNKNYNDEYDIEDIEVVMKNASSEFNDKCTNNYLSIESKNDLSKFWVEVKNILSSKKFSVLYLYYKEGMNEREIGDTLKIKQNTVSGHKIDAEKKLKNSKLLKNKFDLKDFLK